MVVLLLRVFDIQSPSWDMGAGHACCCSNRILFWSAVVWLPFGWHFAPSTSG